MKKVARFCCVDPRQPKEGVYSWSSAGGLALDDMIENFVALIDIFDEIEIVSHSDCAYMKTQLGFDLGSELSSEEEEKLRVFTEEQRALAVNTVSSHSTIKKAISSGLKVKVGHFDVVSKTTTWF